MSSTLVKQVIISTSSDGVKPAVGVELSYGRKISAKREIILSTGSIRTPQILMLSGIGPASELQKHGIEQHVDSPDIGEHLWDHLGLFQQWRLRDPDLGAAMGSAKFVDPAFQNGNSMDWHTTASVPKADLKAALKKDLGEVPDSHPFLASPRCHLGLLVHYVGTPMDGSIIKSYALNYLPTARGTITLASADPEENPVLDHYHYPTEADRYRLRTVIRMMRNMMMATEAGKKIVVGEDVIGDLKAISEIAIDEEIDERMFVGSQ
jgi:choline dehydrogenase-like flavoprotein